MLFPSVTHIHVHISLTTIPSYRILVILEMELVHHSWSDAILKQAQDILLQDHLPQKKVDISSYSKT